MVHCIYKKKQKNKKETQRLDIVQKVCNRAPAGGRRLRDGCCNRTSDEDCSDRERVVNTCTCTNKVKTLTLLAVVVAANNND